jgi:hypothetical protein
MRTLLSTLALAALTAPALAQELAEDDRAAIAERIETFESIMQGGDMAALYDEMPQRLRSSIASQAGVSEEEVEVAMRAQVEAMMATATIDGFSMDLDAATVAGTPDGSTTYALIPTITEITMDGTGSVRATSQTLALEDEGEWYLLRVDDPAQVALLGQVYPAFAGVEFVPGTMEPVE